jgi:uncharacterized protein YdaU (DUF1376 family)
MKDFKLTRFDFDAAEFLADEDVAGMTAAEVGQLVLLLCAAWLGGKDATLPDDPRILARLARATTGRISPVVMRKFISTGGGRLLNLPLSSEWKSACARAKVRSEKAQKAATKRWSEDAPSMPQALPRALQTQCLEMPSSSSPNPSDDDDKNHHHQSDDDFRASLLRAKSTYLARCDGNIAQIDFALTEIINRTAGPVSSPSKFFDKALEKFFDPSNERDRELLQQWLVHRPMRQSAVVSPGNASNERRADL